MDVLGDMKASQLSSGSGSKGNSEQDDSFVNRGVSDMGFPQASIDLGNGNCST